MALSKSYYTVGGEILAERTAGGGRVNYGVDALGSVTSTLVVDAVQNRYSYKPYGSELSRSGAGADPSFRWVGSLGYRQTGRVYSESYVTARHYAQTLGRWSNAPIPSATNAYKFSSDSPLSDAHPARAGNSSCILGPERPTLSKNCWAQCNGIWPCIHCDFSLRFNFRWKVSTNGSASCPSCVWYQWLRRDYGPWQRDDVCGWPIMETASGNCKGVAGCTTASCHFHDVPGWSGPRPFDCGPSSTTIKDFITCVCCPGGTKRCWGWRIVYQILDGCRPRCGHSTVSTRSVSYCNAEPK